MLDSPLSKNKRQIASLKQEEKNQPLEFVDY